MIISRSLLKLWSLELEQTDPYNVPELFKGAQRPEKDFCEKYVFSQIWPRNNMFSQNVPKITFVSQNWLRWARWLWLWLAMARRLCAGARYPSPRDSTQAHHQTQLLRDIALTLPNPDILLQLGLAYILHRSKFLILFQKFKITEAISISSKKKQFKVLEKFMVIEWTFLKLILTKYYSVQNSPNQKLI